MTGRGRGRNLRLPVLSLLLFVVVAVGCTAARPTPTPTPTATPTVTPTPTPTATPTPTPTPAATPTITPTAKKPTQRDVLDGLLRAGGSDDATAVAQLVLRDDVKAFVPPLVDMLQFLFFYNDFFLETVGRTLQRITGQEIDPLDYYGWVEWLGKQEDVQPPEGYGGWKGELLSQWDPAFKEFLYDGAPTRIRLDEVVWGGAGKDTIPDLKDPRFIAASQATYLLPDDRVFGVSINGDHRAYPLRILNWHEMANDVVGGVPVSLAY